MIILGRDGLILAECFVADKGVRFDCRGASISFRGGAFALHFVRPSCDSFPHSSRRWWHGVQACRRQRASLRDPGRSCPLPRMVGLPYPGFMYASTFFFRAFSTPDHSGRGYVPSLDSKSSIPPDRPLICLILDVGQDVALLFYVNGSNPQMASNLARVRSRHPLLLQTFL